MAGGRPDSRQTEGKPNGTGIFGTEIEGIGSKPTEGSETGIAGNVPEGPEADGTGMGAQTAGAGGCQGPNVMAQRQMAPAPQFRSLTEGGRLAQSHLPEGRAAKLRARIRCRRGRYRGRWHRHWRDRE